VVIPATNIPTVAGTMTVNTGSALQQTQAVNSGTVAFLQISTNKYRGVDLTPVSALGSTTVVITTTNNGGCTSTGTGSPAYATRCYNITPTTNNVVTTVRLWALTSQLNGIAEANLNVYRYSGGWTQLATNRSTGNDAGSYSYGQADTPAFSSFLLGGPTAPTAITLQTWSARASSSWLPWGLLISVALLLSGGLLLVRLRRRA
jgi:PGF-pre-PGF domain-containing protein